VGASLIIRRIHLYLALFLTPWMLMYALSTVAMNHRHGFEAYYGEQALQWEAVSEERFHHGLAEPSRADVANQILSHLGIEGAHNTRGRLDRRITITRDNPWDTRRISWSASDSLLTVERRQSRLPVILESLHRRRGFQHDILTEDLWAVTVDLVILAMVFWAGSGIWLWWEMSVTRKLGAVALASGLLLYALFLVTI
jgi:hypothetical protein